MLPPDGKAAVSALATALAELRPFAESGRPLVVPPSAAAAAPGYLAPLGVAAAVASRLGLPAPVAAAAGDVFSRVVTDRLAPLIEAPALASVPLDSVPEVAAVAGRTGLGWPEPEVVTALDGTRLRSYRTGDSQAPAVVIASACGMPAQLLRPWIRALSPSRHVVTWETRGLFGDRGEPEEFDRVRTDTATQAADLLAVMDHHRISSAHVMGLCGGAVLALQAAAEQPERVSSLSLWHGDYELGPGCPKTEHQHNLKALFAMVARGRSAAAAIHTALLDTTMASTPADVAHLVLYPYADAELFYRYCLVTRSVMDANVASMVAAVDRRALVVTSETDLTAHPGGSLEVAARLPGSTLAVEPSGDHISVFAAGPRLQSLLTAHLDS